MCVWADLHVQIPRRWSLVINKQMLWNRINVFFLFRSSPEFFSFHFDQVQFGVNCIRIMSNYLIKMTFYKGAVLWWKVWYFLHILHWRITIRARPGILTRALLQWRFITMVLELVIYFFDPSSRSYTLLFFKIFQNLLYYTQHAHHFSIRATHWVLEYNFIHCVNKRHRFGPQHDNSSIVTGTVSWENAILFSLHCPFKN